MGLFNKATDFLGSVIHTASDAVGNTAAAAVGAVSGAASAAVGAVTQTATAALGQGAATSAGQADTVGHATAGNSALPVVATESAAASSNPISVIGSALADVGKTAMTSTVNGVTQAVANVFQVNFENGTLKLGDSNGLLGINAIGSLFSSPGNDGVIPDTRGILGPLPINVSFDSNGLNFGGETPLTQLLSAAMLLTPVTAPLAAVISPLNLGGLGVVGTINLEGVSAKVYGIAGPSVNLGVANAGVTGEVGNYSQLKLIDWSSLHAQDLPVIGGLLGHLPLIKDLPVPKLDLHLDSKLYAQLIGGADVPLLGLEPKVQLEAVHDVDNDLSILLGIVGDTAHSAVEGVGQVVALLVGHGDAAPAAIPAPEVALIGSEAANDSLALAA